MLKGMLRNLALLTIAGLFTTGLAVGQKLERGELRKLIASASTSQDHERIANHYAARAAELEADAKEHQELAAEYKRSPTGHELKHPMSGQTAGHCELFAKRFADAAKEARQLAADHMAMAKSAK